MNQAFRNDKILELKLALIENYFMIMSVVLLFFVFYFYFLVESIFMFYYFIFGSIVTIFSWFFLKLKTKISIQKFVYYYLWIAPLYNIIIMLEYWPFSIVSFVWLVPLPLGAYIFFSRKEVILFSAYSLFILLFVVLFADNFSNFFLNLSHSDVRISEIVVLSSNILIISLLVYYKDKIRKLETMSEIEEMEKIELPVTLEKKELEHYKSIFFEIEKLMKEDELFKDINLNISHLSTILNVNNSYVSRCFRYEGFNFSSYVNSYRIDYVVKLLDSVDLEKVTMLYIYTEAGFKSQSTFNRVFKDQLGVTPTEYLDNLKSKRIY